tara:strand:+ start:859 stop:1167 length:309 start_codon:yes stop_codon:yes gene_type:complete
MGRVNTGNNYLVNQARSQQSFAPRQALSPVEANRMANNPNNLPQEQMTVAGAAQARSSAGSTTQQAALVNQARNNMGGGTAPQSMGLLQRAGYQLPGSGQVR